MAIKNFLDANLRNKKVILRVDYNVPLKGTKITDDNRIRESLATIKTLLTNDCKIIIISHLGRPEGKAMPALSLKPVAKKLQRLLGKKVIFINKTLGHEVEKICANLKPRQIVLLENLRFHKEEEHNDPQFARKLAQLGEIYIDDAFGCAHRAHASIAAITEYLPSFAGALLQKEVDNLTPLLHSLKYPVTMIIGGAKIDTKIDLIKSFAGRVDHFIMGGGIANTFLAAKGYHLAESLVEKEKLSVAREIETLIRRKNKNVHLPDDYITASRISNFVKTSRLQGKSIPKGQKVLDIGPHSASRFAEIIKTSKTIIWNGPLGVTEFRPFRNGTRIIAKAIVYATSKGARSILGGGDTVDAIKVLKIKAAKFTHVSTGGGAMLEFLEKSTLPGLEVLEK